MIGAGAWSERINSAIRASGKNWEAEVISARRLISMDKESNEFQNTCEKFELIWITTTPQNQIHLLKKLISSNKKVILEKPIATHESEIVTLRKIFKNSQCKIYLSQPWTFSMLWKEAKDILLKMDGDLTIQTERGGILLRPGFAPEIDWAPHDLYLLYDYAHDLGEKKSHISLTSRMLKEKSIQLRYLLETNLIFEIEAGYFNPRRALWRVYSGNIEVLNFDFQSSELIDYRMNPSTRKEFNNDNPIMTMLDYTRENDPNINLELMLELYQDLLQRS